ncbi:unnamed protein product [Linum trigynum]|uniref:Uncharacterized protein n=1 Tax=Linum trigynum TaxID=586398 RepID=A0AAV2CWT1_9ROSI
MGTFSTPWSAWKFEAKLRSSLFKLLKVLAQNRKAVPNCLYGSEFEMTTLSFNSTSLGKNRVSKVIAGRARMRRLKIALRLEFLH